jgi:Caspase domain
MSNVALGVGINAYLGAPLNGCVPDIKSFIDAIQTPDIMRDRVFTFESDVIRSCTDERADAQGFRDRLQWAVANAKPGDRIAIWYSGHGAQIPVRNDAGEPDNEMEVLCPYDFSFDDSDSQISDVDFIELFSDIPAGCNCTIVLDSCFSGGMFAGGSKNGRAFEVRSRSYPITNFDLKVRIQAARARKVAVMRLARRAELSNIAVIEGCREDQTCADAWIGHEYRGALSFYLWQAITDEPDRSLVETVAAASGKLKAAGYEQVPMITGPEEILSKPYMAYLT